MKTERPDMALSDIASTTATEQTISSWASKYGMGGGMVTSILGYLSSSGAAVLIGVMATILGCSLSAYYQRKRDKREQHEAELREREIALRERLQLADEKRHQELHEAKLEALRSGVIDTI